MQNRRQNDQSTNANRGNNRGSANVQYNRGNDRHYDNRRDHRRDYRPGYDRRHYNRNYRSERRYHFGHYAWPRGYRYHRWGYGDYVPQVFFADRYRIVSFWLYGLMPPPPGTFWVRYGPDALLVDAYSREIIRVVYNVFY